MLNIETQWTERKMLDLAAKAAGILLDWSDRSTEISGIPWRVRRLEPNELEPGETDGTSPVDQWHPLSHDGDAFRLMVTLGMEVYVDSHPNGCACTEAWSVSFDKDRRHTSVVNHDGDPAAATRRAIVIVAAEIGRRMP